MERYQQRPWDWLYLTHVCREWQHVISMSPRRLDLHILCEYGAPIENIIRGWPTLPLFVLHNRPESRSLPHNIVVALRDYADRVQEIDLDLPSSLIGSILEMIQEPFRALKCLRISVKNATGRPMLINNSEAFLGGSAPHLREVRLDDSAFPFLEIGKVLLFANTLTDLHLSNIPNDTDFSPDDLVTGLTTLGQLKRLTLGFYSSSHASFPPPNMTLPRRTTLPSLTSFNFRGDNEYIEEFVALIDSPALCEITIMFFNNIGQDIDFEISQFCQFIHRLNSSWSPTWVFVTHTVGSVSVFFVQEGKPLNENYFLEASCGPLYRQLSFVTEILSQLSPFLSSVRSLSIRKGYESLTGEEDVDSTQWLELFQSLTHVTQLDVWVNQLVPGIVEALVAEDMATEVLPDLTGLRLRGYRSSSSVEAAEQFVATRTLSGRAISLFG